MATTLFLHDTVADTHLGTNNADLVGTARGWTSQALATTRGDGLSNGQYNTVAGPTVGIDAFNTGAVQWISPPVSADVTISGTITANLWASESNMSANVAINVVIDIIRANALATNNSNTIVEIVRSTRTTEVAVTTRAVNNFTTGMTSGAYTSQTLNRGDRLRIRVFGDDSTANMGTGFTFDFSYAGTTGGVDGDSFVTFSETFSFESAPAGSQLFLTDTAVAVPEFPVVATLLDDFNRADENPLSGGGNWADINSSFSQDLRITSNQVTSTGANSAGSYWTPGNFGPEVEAYATMAVVPSTNLNYAVIARVTDEGGAATYDGWAVQTSGASTLALIFYSNGTPNTLDSISTTISAGDKIGIRIVDDTIEGWLYHSSAWNRVCVGQSTFSAAAGKVGMLILGTSASSGRFDDFYAGTLSSALEGGYFLEAWTSRGGGVTSKNTSTQTGWVAPIQIRTGTGSDDPVIEWYTKQLNAFTLTGMAQANIRALESNASANASLRCEIARVDSDGTNATVWASWCCAPTGSDNGELATSEVARTINVSGDDLAVSDGQRLRIRLYAEDQSAAAMATAFNVQTFYNGTSAAASGDTYVTLAQSVSEFIPAVFMARPINTELQSVKRASLW